MILEFSVLSSATNNVTFSFESTFDPLNQTHDAEIRCAGGSGVQINVNFTFNASLSTPSMSVYEGELLTLDDYGRRSYVTICTQAVNGSIEISSSSTLQFLSTLASSIDFGVEPVDQTVVTREAIDRFDQALAKRASIYNEHVQAWTDLWKSGIDVQPVGNQSMTSPKMILDANGDGENDTIIETFSRTLDIAQHINSSMYFLLSSSREDWPLVFHLTLSFSSMRPLLLDMVLVLVDWHLNLMMVSCFSIWIGQ